MLMTITGNGVFSFDNEQQGFDGVSGLYHTVGVMSTSEVGQVLMEYRVRGHGSWTVLTTINLSDLDNLEPITFTAPITHWRITSIGTNGITTLTDTQLKSSAGMVSDLQSQINQLPDLDTVDGGSWQL